MTIDKDPCRKLSQIDEEPNESENEVIVTNENEEYTRRDNIQIGFEQELKSITVYHGDSARFEAKIRLLTLSSRELIDRSLLNVEWRFNDILIVTDSQSRYQLGSSPNENRYWMTIRNCQRTDEKVYTIHLSYDNHRYHDESSAYLFVQSKSISTMVSRIPVLFILTLLVREMSLVLHQTNKFRHSIN